MSSIYRHVMRTVLIALLIQVVSPAFLSIITQGANPIHSDHPSLHAHHCSVVIPQLLKEKDDESDDKADNVTANYVALIDFTDHTAVLTQHHENKITPFIFRDRFDPHPPLFTLHGVFLI
jgi:hypothetical protein